MWLCKRGAGWGAREGGRGKKMKDTIKKSLACESHTRASMAPLSSNSQLLPFATKKKNPKLNKFTF